jgi:hypothetical protein
MIFPAFRDQSLGVRSLEVAGNAVDLRLLYRASLGELDDRLRARSPLSAPRLPLGRVRLERAVDGFLKKLDGILQHHRGCVHKSPI